MPDWTAERPLQVVTGYTRIAERFFRKHGFKHVALSSADGALEAGPLMGTADIILDLVTPPVCRYHKSCSICGAITNILAS